MSTRFVMLSGTKPSYASSDERRATSEMLDLVRDRTHFSARSFVFRMLLGMPGDFLLCILLPLPWERTYSSLLLLSLALALPSTGITSHDFKLGWEVSRLQDYRQRVTQTSAFVC